jgi:hypothetical protein
MSQLDTLENFASKGDVFGQHALTFRVCKRIAFH